MVRLRQADERQADARPDQPEPPERPLGRESGSTRRIAQCEDPSGARRVPWRPSWSSSSAASTISCMSRGATLPVTVMTPCAPAPISSRQLASSPESSRKSSPQRSRISRPRAMLPVASLMPMICGWPERRSTVSGSRSQAVREGHVVKDERHARGVGDHAEVPVQALLRRPVVIRRDDEHAVGAEFAGGARALDGLRRRAPPVPAITGSRPPSRCTAICSSSADSAAVSVADSPVVPPTTTPSLPSRACQSSRRANAT